jgi:hypothetical protein
MDVKADWVWLVTGGPLYWQQVYIYIGATNISEEQGYISQMTSWT